MAEVAESAVYHKRWLEWGMPDVLGVRMALDSQVKDGDDGAGGGVVKEGRWQKSWWCVRACGQDLSETGGFVAKDSRRITAVCISS